MFKRIAMLILILSLTVSLGEVEGKSIKGTPGFIMANNLMGIIEWSSDKSKIGEKFAFIDLLSEKPKVLYESGVTSSMNKVFESEKTLTILLVAGGSGSTDTFTINKKTGTFARATTSAALLDSMEVDATASVGTLK